MNTTDSRLCVILLDQLGDSLQLDIPRSLVNLTDPTSTRTNSARRTEGQAKRPEGHIDLHRISPILLNPDFTSESYNGSRSHSVSDPLLRPKDRLKGLTNTTTPFDRQPRRLLRDVRSIILGHSRLSHEGLARLLHTPRIHVQRPEVGHPKWCID